MSFRLSPTLAERLAAADRTLAGVWTCSGNALMAEICAGSGLDLIVIDMEHSPNELADVLAQLQAVAAYPAATLVRVPIGDTVIIKRVLDLGAQNLLVPMITTADEARAVVAAVRYPTSGCRGVGAGLARSSRWNRVADYAAQAHTTVSLFVQVESREAVENAAEIAAVEGVDGVFVGPADLAGSLGLLGQQTHPDVLAAVRRVFDAVHAAGKPVGVNAFEAETARGYAEAGADFVLVGADVSLLARGSEALAAAWVPFAADAAGRGSY